MLTRFRRNVPTTPAFTRDPFFNFVDRFFNELSWPASGVPGDATEGNGSAWMPAVDVVENEDAYVVTADLPGLKKEDVDVSLDDGVLTISGERRFESKSTGPEGEDNEGRKGFRRFERAYGSFRRSFSLPQGLDFEKVEAKFADGELTLTLPKAEVTKSRKISIQ